MNTQIMQRVHLNAVITFGQKHFQLFFQVLWKIVEGFVDLNEADDQVC